MTNKSNDVTGDRITNALKGDKDKYRENWDKIFGKKKDEGCPDEERVEKLKELSRGVDRYIEETRGMTSEERGYFTDDFVEITMEPLGEEFKLSEEEYLRLCEEDNNDLLDEITQMNQDMGLYDDES